MKTADLEGAALDWAVAKAEGDGHETFLYKGVLHTRFTAGTNGWNPSADWAQGGPIIEREQIGIWWHVPGTNSWMATRYLNGKQGFGPTPLIAAMRCYVASKRGDEVDVPDELTR